jgi:hypothetical protein
MNEPVWTQENQDKKQGDTTFNTCGWCKYAGSGSCRHDCHLESKCNLLKSYDKEVAWDTECLVMKLGRDDLLSIIGSKEYGIKEYEQSITHRLKEIEKLNELVGEAKQSPPLAKNRKSDHFNIGDRIYVYIEKAWAIGTVAMGYRHHDGCVSFSLDSFPATKAKPWGGGFAVPTILLEREMNFFKTKGEFRDWLKIQDDKYNGDRINIEAICAAWEAMKA